MNVELWCIMLVTVAQLALWIGQKMGEYRLDRIEKQLGIKVGTDRKA